MRSKKIVWAERLASGNREKQRKQREKEKETLKKRTSKRKRESMAEKRT